MGRSPPSVMIAPPRAGAPGDHCSARPLPGTPPPQDAGNRRVTVTLHP